MLWIGAIFGALFGWIGILVAALFWLTLAIFKLIWALTLFVAQLIFAISGLIARAIIKGIEYLLNRKSNTMKAVRPALTPKRTRRRR
jgi:hypothetical protein